MENKSNIYIGKDGLAKLMVGFNGVADAVKLTLGPAGSNAILEEGLYPGFSVTNDGKSIGDKIYSEDQVQNIGIKIAKEILQKSDRDGGATTTSIVLAQAILQEGLKVQGVSPMDIKRSLDELIDPINKSIDDQTKEITVDDIGKVASVSADSETLGAVFQEIYKIIGKDGIVELDTSTIPETTYTITDGVRLRNAGWTYPYMANDAKGKSAVYKSPHILITKQKISTLQDLDGLFRGLSEQGIGELVIFCDEIDPMVSQAIAQTHMQGIFKTLVIKAPTLWKDWLFEDFAMITGAKIVDPAQGTTFKTLKLTDLGTCSQITTTKDETVVRGIKDIRVHVKRLEEIGTEEARLRLSWLQTKTAILKLGASSESELSYIRLKADDARNESYLALQHGVVAGGGVALLNASHLSTDRAIGAEILRVALKKPWSQILENAGIESVEYEGYDARTGKPTDMFEAGILDSSKVIKNAIKNAISIAGTILTTKVIVTEPKKMV